MKLKSPLAVAMVTIAATLAPVRASAQDTSPDTIAPMAVVRELFAAMKAGDSARVRAVFHPQMAALMSSEVGKDGVARVSATPVDAFVRVFAAPRPAAIDERISRPRTLVDGTLASVWADYDLFVGSQFMHCGVDVIHVAKVGEVWKIVALSDTRRTTGCRK